MGRDSENEQPAKGNPAAGRSIRAWPKESYNSIPRFCFCPLNVNNSWLKLGLDLVRKRVTRQVHKSIMIITPCKLDIYKREILETAQVSSDYAGKDGSLLNFGELLTTNAHWSLDIFL